MNNLEITTMDFGLLYLSNFDEGLNYYQWDRKITYDLKSKISPNAYIADFKNKGLAKEFIKDNTKFYVLTELGTKYCKGILSRYRNVFKTINETIVELEKEGYQIDRIQNNLPVISFFYSERKYKFILEKLEDEIYVKILLPNNLKDAVNKLKISIRGIEDTKYLKEILIANFKLFYHHSA